MKIVQFLIKDGRKEPSIGVILEDQRILNLSDPNNGIPNTLIELLALNDGLERLQKASKGDGVRYNMDDVKLLAPITKPDKVLVVGLNYKGHCAETNFPEPKEPIVFSKFSSCITGPNDDVPKPKATNAMDWEVELVIVIGKRCKEVAVEQARDYVLGFTACQDLTARDWHINNRNGGQYLFAKSMDQFLPLGPCIVTKDEIANPENLRLRTWVNGVLKQDGNTNDLVHGIDALVSHISQVMTLYPGDVILSGTPGGVGFWRTPSETLQVGDHIKSEVEQIGVLSNKIV